MMNNLDPAQRQITFKGFEDMQAPARIAYLETLLQDNQIRYSGIDHIFTGPKNNQLILGISFVKFSSSRATKEALQKLGGKNKEFSVSENIKIKMKSAISAINLKRNWSIRQAHELIRNSPLSNNNSIEIDFKERKVLVGGSPAFTQSPNQLKGTFLKPFNSLRLP